MARSHFLPAVLFLLLVVGVWERGETNHTILGQFLERAESTGIINTKQQQDLHQLASSMNLTMSTVPDRTAQHVPDQAESSGSTDCDQSSTTDCDQRTSVFMHVYNHLTLLNVLYLSGAVVIMGAYTIFMTLAVEQCNYFGMSVIMSVQVAVSGVSGLVLWPSVDYAYVGGM